MAGNLTQLQRGTFVMLGTLEPLTSYQFELRVCTASVRYNCSLWSRSIIQRSSAKGKGSSNIQTIKCPMSSALQLATLWPQVHFPDH